MTAPRLELVSFKTCPFVQRAAIVLHEKAMPFEITYIDRTNRPDWFLKISPLGKVPLLKVDDSILFESAVIAEYLDEVYPPRLLHPTNALRRAHNRAWIEFSSTLLSSQFQMLMSADRVSFDTAAARFGELLDRLEAELGPGPFFNGAGFALVDCAFAPLFMRMTIMEPYLKHGALARRPRIQAWSKTLLARPAVQRSVVPDFAELLIDSWRARAPLGRELFAMTGS